MIRGTSVQLRSARLSEREMVYRWMTSSDVVASMLGPPLFPDVPIPSWEEFCCDYTESFFADEFEQSGKVYIIVKSGEKIGTIGYDLLSKDKNHVVLDIWLKSLRWCGHGYGGDALNALCCYLHAKSGITRFFIGPSARNRRACAVYRKCGFLKGAMTDAEIGEEFGEVEIFDYQDTVMMKKEL